MSLMNIHDVDLFNPQYRGSPSLCTALKHAAGKRDCLKYDPVEKRSQAKQPASRQADNQPAKQTDSQNPTSPFSLKNTK